MKTLFHHSRWCKRIVDGRRTEQSFSYTLPISTSVVAAIARGRIRPRQTTCINVRNLSTRLEYDKRYHPRDSSCSCSCCSERQQRQYTTIASLDHNHIQSSTTCWFDPSSSLSRQQCRDKSDITNPDGGASGTTTAVAAGGKTVMIDEPSIPGAQKGGRKLAIVFTCTVCDTRSIKQFTENAYNNGVVIVQCPGCQNRHLIADNLSFFEDGKGGWNIEKALSEMGENVKVVNNDNVMELSVEDLFGAEKIREVADTGGASDGKP